MKEFISNPSNGDGSDIFEDCQSKIRICPYFSRIGDRFKI